MKTLTVDLPGRAYDILIERGLLDRVGEEAARVLPRAKRLFVVTDSHVALLYLDRVAGSLKRAGFEVFSRIVPAGERSKCVEQLSALWEDMMEQGLTRTDAVIALGGGVVGDLAGFAAATILRGVDYVQIPTTLLAQVDSSVGGKVAIDLRHGKNLTGAFWQPKVVLMDPEVLETLPDSTFADGMAEVVKYGCIADGDFLRDLEAAPGRARIMGRIEEVLYTCCRIKRDVVLKDERDTGERMMLNFGHTLGHAYELAGRYETWTHGQAVAAGMVRASQVGETLGVTEKGTAGRIEKLLSALGLPTSIPCSLLDYTLAVGLDKKGAGDKITLILLDRPGHTVYHQMQKQDLLNLL